MLGAARLARERRGNESMSTVLLRLCERVVPNLLGELPLPSPLVSRND
jgi:hypothetical protein